MKIWEFNLYNFFAERKIMLDKRFVLVYNYGNGAFYALGGFFMNNRGRKINLINNYNNSICKAVSALFSGLFFYYYYFFTRPIVRKSVLML